MPCHRNCLPFGGSEFGFPRIDEHGTRRFHPDCCSTSLATGQRAVTLNRSHFSRCRRRSRRASDRAEKGPCLTPESGSREAAFWISSICCMYLRQPTQIMKWSGRCQRDIQVESPSSLREQIAVMRRQSGVIAAIKRISRQRIQENNFMTSSFSPCSSVPAKPVDFQTSAQREACPMQHHPEIAGRDVQCGTDLVARHAVDFAEQKYPGNPVR